MEAAVLQRLHTDGHLDAKEIRDILGVDISTAYRYIGGTTELRVCQYRSLIRHCKSDTARLALLSVYSGGAPGVIITIVEAELDINGDGRVDTRDVMTATATIIRDGADLVDLVSNETVENGDLSVASAQRILDMAPVHIQTIAAIEQIARLTIDRESRRRKARPLSSIQLHGGDS